MFIDTHTHLSLITQNYSKIQNIIDKCNKNDIRILFNISVDYNSNFINKEISEKFDNIYFTVGIHPSEADRVEINKLKDIEKIINHSKCIGIGETGLDFYRNYSSVENQIKLFKYQIKLAKDFNKPLIIHSRNSFYEVIKILEVEMSEPIKAVFHCFSYSIKEAKILSEFGFKISFAGNITYKNSKLIQEAAKELDIKNIFLETDSPYLAPASKRGEINYPYNLIDIINFLSNLKELPIKIIEKEIEKNIIEYFKINVYTNRNNN